MSNPDTTENASQPQAVQLTPPADLELTAPQPVQPVAPESAAGRVKLKPGDVAELDAQVRAFIDAMTGLDEQDPKFKDCLDITAALRRQFVVDVGVQFVLGDGDVRFSHCSSLSISSSNVVLNVTSS